MAEQMAEGWYHAQGDPAGTVRWWDGEMWTGGPVQDPAATPGTMPGAPGTGAGPIGTYATWGQRFAALLIDGLLMLAGYIPLFVLAAIAGAINDGLAALVLILGYLALLAAWIYLMPWGQGITGQTPGKRIMGIQVVKDGTGEFMGGGLGIGRWFASILNSLPLYLGWLWPLFDDKNQTFADKIVSTVVTQTDRPKKLLPLFPNGKPF